ncbi:MAG: HlyU family transcriptional regulator [Shimia sp.]
MSWLKKLFGGAASAAAATPSAVEHKGFKISPDPERDGGKWRIAAVIEGPKGQRHHMIRADTLESQEAASEASLLKAKQFIDQQGLRIFD